LGADRDPSHLARVLHPEWLAAGGQNNITRCLKEIRSVAKITPFW
jgi:hypothetical protein